MRTVDQLFLRAAGRLPDEGEARMAADGLPAALQVPAGNGRGGVVLAWLWRRLYGAETDRARTPRRLIWALPPGALLEPSAAEVRGWLTRLELTESVGLHVIAGARGENLGDWRENMHQPAIVVGPVDLLLSRALNRGYGVSPAIWPIDFALTVNGAHWVIDEARLCPRSTATLRQIAQLAGEAGTAEPFGMTLVSAMPRAEPGGTLMTSGGTGGAARTFRRLPAAPGDYAAIAAETAARHGRGTRTLVTLNTVDAAQQVYRRLRGGPTEVALLHARFRGIERGDLLPAGEDLIIVATPTVEAGVGDLNAALLLTEAAPWASVVLRAGHAGTVTWVPPAAAGPYRPSDIDACVAELGRLEGRRVPYAELLDSELLAGEVAGAGVDGDGDGPAMIGAGALAELFDTSTDEPDVSGYVRDADDLELEVAWATWTRGADGAPDPSVRLPLAEYRCRIGLRAALRLAGDRAVWRFDRAADGWRTVSPPGMPPVSSAVSPAGTLAPLRPGELLLVDAADGGYDPETGFDPLARGPVPDCPALLTPDEQADLAALAAALTGVPGAADAVGPAAPRSWQSLNEHSEQVRDQAAALLRAIAPPGVPAGAARSAVIAGWLHDAGKAHPIWQDALCALAEPDERDEVAAGRPWAKSGGRGGRLEFAGDVPFRHELASLLLADGPLGPLLDQAPDRDLARFLVVAHHGKLRVQIGDRDTADHADLAVGLVPDGLVPEIRGLRQGARCAIPPVLGCPAATLTVDLSQFAPGGTGLAGSADSPASWAGAVSGLLARYGPFVLAYLEAIVRIADWRASGGRELADIAPIDIPAKTAGIGDTGYSPPLKALPSVTPTRGAGVRPLAGVPHPFPERGGAGACGSPRAAASCVAPAAATATR